MSGLRWRYIVIFLALVLTLAYSLPNVAGPSLQKILPNSKVNLGLDLRGGIHLTLGVDVDKAVTNSLALTGQDLRREAMDRKIVVLRPHVVGGSSLEFILPRADDESAFTEFAAKRFPQLSLGQPVKGDAGQLRYVAHFTDQEVKRLETLTMDQALRTIRNRIDQFGVAEPDIRKQSDNRIQVQLPGVEDPNEVKKLLGKTAKMTLHFVDETTTMADARRGKIDPDLLAAIRNASGILLLVDPLQMPPVAEALGMEPDSEDAADTLTYIIELVRGRPLRSREKIDKPLAVALSNAVISIPLCIRWQGFGAAIGTERFCGESDTLFDFIHRELIANPSGGADHDGFGGNSEFASGEFRHFFSIAVSFDSGACVGDAAVDDDRLDRALFQHALFAELNRSRRKEVGSERRGECAGRFGEEQSHVVGAVALESGADAGRPEAARRGDSAVLNEIHVHFLFLPYVN